MSFDLAVWFEAASSLSPAAADATHARLCEEDLTGIVADDRVAAFHSALTAIYPELDTVRDEDLEGCPWNSVMGVSPGHVLMLIGWSWADEITPLVRRLAREHGLVCFNPQTGAVYAPGAESPRRLHWTCCDGMALIRPDVVGIEHELGRLSERNWFACLEDDDGRYIQVGIGLKAGVADGEFAVEHRDGSAERHYRQVTTSLDVVKSGFRAFFNDGTKWLDGPSVPVRF